MSAVRSRQGRAGAVVRYVVLVVLALLFLLPFYVIVRNAFADNATIVAPQWQWIPKKLDFGVLSELFGDSELGIMHALGVSAVQSVLQTGLTVLVSLLAGYALARLRSTAGRILTGITLFTLMVPAAVTFLPTFVMTAQLRWIDSLQGLVVPVMFSAFATYMFRQSFLTFPTELEEAAMIDGASPWGTFWRVVFPNSLGIVGAVGTITFIGAWNAFLWPLLIAREKTQTVQLVLSQFMTSQGVQYPELFAGALVAVVPVVGVFLFLQRFLVQGMETSGLR